MNCRVQARSERSSQGRSHTPFEVAHFSHEVVVAKEVLATRGFSLLELIIASASVATLMLLVWSLFGVYSKLNDRGAEKATELQLVRSLMRQLRADLHHIPVPAIGANSTRSVASESTAETFDEPVSLPPGGTLVGSETSLHFIVRSTRRKQTAASADELGIETVYDVVAYDWKAHDSLFPLDVEDQPGVVLPREDQASGLTRYVEPWVLWQEKRSDPQVVTALTVVESTVPDAPPQRENRDFVPEVASLRFRYFDGTLWLSQWDSQVTGRLPAAVELAFDLKIEGEDEMIERQRPSSPSQVDVSPVSSRAAVDTEYFPDTADMLQNQAAYRFVIAVAVAWPSEDAVVAARLAGEKVEVMAP